MTPPPACPGAPLAFSGASWEALEKSVVDGTPARWPFRVISCTPEETILEFTLPEYVITHLEDEEGVVWSAISAEGAENMDVAGKPSLPVYLLAYGAVPGSAVQAEVRDVASETLSDCRPLPGRGPYLRTQEPPELIPSEETYGANGGVYPAENASLVSSYQIRGIQGTGIVFSPFQYDSGVNSVTVVTRCTVVLRSDSSDAAVLDSQSDFAQMQTSIFVNSASFRSEGSATVGKLSILVPDGWRDSETLAEFVAWKQSVGWTVEVAGYPTDTTREEEVEGEEEKKERDDILAWSEGQYASGMTHLLLLGDYEAIPPYQHGKQGWGDDGKMNEYLYVASDTAYALLAGESDLSYMDVFMGRMPVSDQDDLEHALRASMYYEHGAYQSDDWTQKAVYIGSSDKSSYWPYAGESDTVMIQNQAARLDTAGIIQREESTELYASSSPTPTALQVSKALNAGASLLLYLGHGSCTKFTTTGFGSANAKGITNQGMLPFVMAPVCYSGNLDHYNAEYDFAVGCPEDTQKCLGQSFFVNNTDLAGIAGGVFASHEAYWNPSIKQIETFAESLEKYRSSERLTSQGAYALEALDATVQFCDTYAEEYEKAESPKGIKANYTTWTGVEHAWIMELLGDPACVLRIGPQAKLTVQWEKQDDGTARIAVTGFDAETPQPVANCAVCFNTQDGTVVCSGRTDSDGVFTVPDAAIRWFTSVNLLDGSGPYLKQSFAPKVDADGDKVVTNQELSIWLSAWQEDYDSASAYASEMLASRDQAIAEWQKKPDTPEAVAENTTPSGTASQDAAVTSGTSPEFSYDDLCEYMSGLSHDYWPYVRPTVVGTSVNGKPIQGVRVSMADENSSVPHLLLLAGAHGDETEAVSCAKSFLETLMSGVTGTDAGVRQWLEANVIWVVPVLNPDGYSIGTKGNAHDVDLEDGFPGECGSMSDGDPTGLYENWKYTDETSHLPEVEQKAFARWMIAHHINSVMLLRQDSECYVSYAGTQSMEFACGVADFAGVGCAPSRAGSLLNWCAEYLGCQALMFAALDADDELFGYLPEWVTNSGSTPAVDTAERLYLPGHEREIPVALTEAGQTPVLRVQLPSGWAVACRSGKCVGVRSGAGYADIALMGDSELQEFSLVVIAAEDFERETRLEFTMDTSDTQSSWSRVMVAATCQEETEISVAEGWNALSVPVAGITPASLGVTEAFIWQDGVFVRVSPENFRPGVGYWVNCAGEKKIALFGWKLDAEAFAVSAGMQFFGTTTGHGTEATLYKTQGDVFQLVPAEEGISAGRAYWWYLPESSVIVP